MTCKDMVLAAANVSVGHGYWFSYLSSTSTLTGIAINTSGNAWVSGIVGSTGSLYMAFRSTTGAVVTQRTQSGGTYNNARSVCIDSSDNISFTGPNNSLGTTYNPMWTFKADAAFTSLWQRYLTNTAYNLNCSEVATNSSLTAICGFTNGATYTDAVVAAFSSSAGTLSWQRRFYGSYNDNLFGVYVDGSSNVYSCGYRADASAVSGSIWVKYGGTGTLSLQRLLSKTGVTVSGLDITLDASGNIFTGSWYQGSFSAVGVLAKYNSAGTLQWQREVNPVSSGISAPFDMITTDSSGNIYGIGRGGASNNKMLIVKYNTSGTLQWIRELSSSTGNMSAYDIRITSDGLKMYICGNVIVSGTNRGFLGYLPTDGSLMGTFGTFSYVNASPYYSDSSGTLTASTPALTSATTTYTTNTTSVSFATPAYSATVTLV